MKRTLLRFVSVLFVLSMLAGLAAAPAYATEDMRIEDVFEWVGYGSYGSTSLAALVLPGCTPAGIDISDPEQVLSNVSVLRQDSDANSILMYAVVNDPGKIGGSAAIFITVRSSDANIADYMIRVTVCVADPAQLGSTASQPEQANPAPQPEQVNPAPQPAQANPGPQAGNTNQGSTGASIPATIPFTGKTGWVQHGNDWYYFYSDGTMAIGWVNTNGQWHYVNAAGKQVTGWVLDSEKWYYLDQNGIMATGWLQDKSKWYYLDATGAMVTGWVNSNDKWYWMDASGAMQTGWVQVDEKWYYLDQNGIMATGWIQDKSKWYYLDASGAMVTGWQEINGKQYLFGADGVRQ